MGNLQTFNPNGVIQAVTGLIYYVLLAGSAFFSLSTIYSLLKYSKSRSLALGVSFVYLTVWGALVASGVSILNSIK